MSFYVTKSQNFLKNQFFFTYAQNLVVEQHDQRFLHE